MISGIAIKTMTRVAASTEFSQCLFPGENPPGGGKEPLGDGALRRRSVAGGERTMRFTVRVSRVGRRRHGARYDLVDERSSLTLGVDFAQVCTELDMIRRWTLIARHLHRTKGRLVRDRKKSRLKESHALVALSLATYANTLERRIFHTRRPTHVRDAQKT